MRIGIDISQLAYSNTGVAVYLQNLVQNLIDTDKENEYVLFYSSMRKNLTVNFPQKNVVLKRFKFPPTILTILWNTLHIVPIEWFIGPVDVFLSSDWTQPPSASKKATIIYDMIIYTYPKETAEKIVQVQKKRLAWVKKEIDAILCISESTKNDIAKFLDVPKSKITVIYPGL